MHLLSNLHFGTPVPPLSEASPFFPDTLASCASEIQTETSREHHVKTTIVSSVYLRDAAVMLCFSQTLDVVLKVTMRTAASKGFQFRVTDHKGIPQLHIFKESEMCGGAGHE